MLGKGAEKKRLRPEIKNKELRFVV